MPLSARSALNRLKNRLCSRPRRRRELRRQFSPEKLEQRALLSTVSIVNGVLTYEADPGEVNRVRIQPTHNATRIRITEETKLYRNQESGDPVTIVVDSANMGGLDFSEGADRRGNFVEIKLNPGREGVTGISVDTGDKDDVAIIGSRQEYGATVHGGAGNDALLTGWGDDVVYGEGGHDKIFTNTGDDLVFGGQGGDHIHGGGHDDTLNGDEGSDTMIGGNGADRMNGGSDRDRLDGRGGDDTLDGGSGDDWLLGHGGTDVVYGGSGSDLFVTMWGREGRTDNDQYWGFRDVNEDGIVDAVDLTDGSVDVVAWHTRYRGALDDSLIGIDKDYNDLQDEGVMVNLDAKHFWQGYTNLMDKATWRGMSGAQKRAYWLEIRENWNIFRDPDTNRFYRHNSF